jgi:hypothetical protein
MALKPDLHGVGLHYMKHIILSSNDKKQENKFTSRLNHSLKGKCPD